MGEIMKYLSFFVWFISLNIMPSRFIHVVTDSKTSFSLSLNISLYKYIYTLYMFVYI